MMNSEDVEHQLGSNESEDDESDESDGRNLQQIYEFVKSVRQQEFTLPDTVAKLEGENDSKVYIVGTSHFSEESIKDVEYILEKTMPDNVVIELCRNRSQMLYMDEEEIKRQMAHLDLVAFVKRYGVSGGLMHYLMLRLSSYIMQQMGTAPGGEFRAAYRKAMQLGHCRLFLGDRPVSITFKRALASLGPWAKLKLFVTLLLGLKPITKEQMEEMKRADLLEQLMRELAGDYPEISRVFIDERDLYLARTIWEASRVTAGGDMDSGSGASGMGDEPGYNSGPTSEGEVRQRRGDDDESQGPGADLPTPNLPPLAPVTVAVVGIGHLAGIRKHWPSAADIDKQKLLVVPSPPLSWRLFGHVCRCLLVSGVLWATYLVGRRIYPVFLWPVAYLWPSIISNATSG